jgi:hypothetical protein
LSRRLPEVQRHGGDGKGHDDSELQNYPQKFCLSPLLIFLEQPNEKNNRNRSGQKQALVWAAIE